MYRKAIFIMTHLGSKWEDLSQILEKDRRIQVYQTGNSYHHPDDVSVLLSNPHKTSNSASVWADVIFYNHDFTMKNMCDHYKFIFWSRPFSECEDQIRKRYGYGKTEAKDYWDYRMYGLNKYYSRCKNSLWNPDLDVNLMLNPIFR